MRQPFFISYIIFVLIMTGCNRGNTLPPAQTPTQASLTKTFSPEPTPITILTPTTSITTSPTFTSSPQPTQTPTVGVTPIPAAISPDNFKGLQLEATYVLPVRGKLRDAKWSQNGDLILARTEIGAGLLSSVSLKQLHDFPGMIPIAELEGGKWLVRSTGQRRYLNLASNDYQLLPVDNLLDELGLDLIARNGETAVRKTGEDEIEVVSLNTGDRRLFNYKEAGYYIKYMRPSLISPDGKLLVVEYTNWPDLHVLNLETMEVVYDLGRPYYDPVFSPDGQYLLIEDNGGFKVLKAKNGIQVNRFSDGFVIRPTPQTYIFYRAMAYGWFPDSLHVGVVYCVEDQKCELYIWSMATGQPETVVKGLPISTIALDFAPDGKGFLTVSNDGFVNTWSIENQTMLAESQPYDRAKPDISPDGHLVAIPRGNQIEIFDVETGELAKAVGDYLGVKELLVDEITENHLLVAGVDSVGPFSDLWDLASDELKRKFRSLGYPNTYSNEPYCTLALQGNRLACGENPLQVFDVETGALLYSNKAQEGKLNWAISPDGNTLATCTVVYTPETYEPIPGDRIFLLDLSASAPVISGVLEAPEGGICSPMIFSPDGQYLAAQSGYIWRLGKGQTPSSFPRLAKAPLVFSPSETLLVSGNRLIQPDTGEVLGELTVNGKVETIGFEANGYRLVLGTDHGVEVWKVSENWQPGDLSEQGSIVVSWPAHPTPDIYDDFSGEKLNLDLWESTAPSGVSYYHFSQSEGVLILRNENSQEMNGFDLSLIKPVRRSISQVTTFEALMNVSGESQGGGFAKIHIYADVPNGSWITQCRLGNQLRPGEVTFVCDIGGTQNEVFSLTPVTDFISVEFDHWYLVRIEFNPETGAIQYYLDGQLLETYTPVNSSVLLNTWFIPSVGVYSFRSDTNLVAKFDDVRITESR